jgi:FAD/FMN-containing dehydrogenase
VDHRPGLIVRPGTPAEVRAAVLTARRYCLPVSVRGGGHDWLRAAKARYDPYGIFAATPRARWRHAA